MPQTYKIERYITYAHRAALLAAATFTLTGVMVAILGFLMPFAHQDRIWYALVMVGAATPLWLVWWLLTQAKTRGW